LIDVVLAPGRDRSVRRRHPWILSGAVARVEGAAEPGAWARVLSAEGEILGFGHFSPSSTLRVRLLSLGKETPAEGFLEARIAEAVERRVAHPLLRGTDALRLVNAEGDGLPGLVADRYRDVVVVRLTSAGMVARREAVASALREASGAAVGFENADSAAMRREGVPAQQGVLWGEAPSEPLWIEERGRRFRVDVVDGQKTGFYLDQREARDLVELGAAGRRVLDLFAYSGGFSVAAARGGAHHVTLVESSATALDLARENLAANAPDLDVRFEHADVHRFLREDEGHYDLITIDPPPLARRRRDVIRATRAYKDALLFALRRAAPGAWLLAFACTHHVGAELLGKVAHGAALDAGRSLRVLHRFGQPADHPVSIDHPEGAYLSGLLLEA
jgi:23S rRNA (cytosine1962-C5)-methyltransferase